MVVNSHGEQHLEWSLNTEPGVIPIWGLERGVLHRKGRHSSWQARTSTYLVPSAKLHSSVWELTEDDTWWVFLMAQALFHFLSQTSASSMCHRAPEEDPRVNLTAEGGRRDKKDYVLPG